MDWQVLKTQPNIINWPWGGPSRALNSLHGTLRRSRACGWGSETSCRSTRRARSALLNQKSWNWWMLSIKWIFNAKITKILSIQGVSSARRGLVILAFPRLPNYAWGPGLMGIRQKRLGRWARCWNIQIKACIRADGTPCKLNKGYLMASFSTFLLPTTPRPSLEGRKATSNK